MCYKGRCRHTKTSKQLQEEEVKIKKQKKKTSSAGVHTSLVWRKGGKTKIIITSRTQEQLEPDVDIQEQFYPLIYPETVLDTRSGTICILRVWSNRPD